jgi:phosphatidylglycerophosphate synthase
LIAILYPLGMLIAVVVAVLRAEPMWVAAAGGAVLTARFVRARGWTKPANLVTLIRLGIVTSLPLLRDLRASGLVFAVIVVGILALDAIDGAIARARGGATAFGAVFDMETDALLVMVLGVLLHASGMPAWVLVAGLWRYVIAIAIAVAPALGQTPPSRLYRSIFGVAVVLFACAFAAPRASLFAAAATVLVTFSFAHSIVRAVTAPARP